MPNPLRDAVLEAVDATANPPRAPLYSPPVARNELDPVARYFSDLLDASPIVRRFLQDALTYGPMALGPGPRAGGPAYRGFQPRFESPRTRGPFGPATAEGFSGTYGGRPVTVRRDQDLLRLVEDVPFPTRPGSPGSLVPRPLTAAPGGPTPVIGAYRPGTGSTHPSLFSPAINERFRLQWQEGGGRVVPIPPALGGIEPVPLPHAEPRPIPGFTDRRNRFVSGGPPDDLPPPSSIWSGEEQTELLRLLNRPTITTGTRRRIVGNEDIEMGLPANTNVRGLPPPSGGRE